MYHRPLFSRQAKANIAAMYIGAAMFGTIIGLMRVADATPTRVGPDYPTAPTSAPTSQVHFTPQAPALAAHVPSARRPVSKVALCAFKVTDTTTEPTSSPGITLSTQPTMTGPLPTTTEVTTTPETTTHAPPTTRATVAPRRATTRATSTTGCR